MPRWFGSAGLILLLLTALAACGESDEGAAQADTPTIVATTSIIGALAEQVAGDRAEVATLIGAGVDPHTYDPSPGDVRAASDADLILMNGIGLDDYLVDRVRSANPDAPVSVVTEGIELHVGEHDHGNDEDDHEEVDGHEEAEDAEHDHGQFDPHVWQDPIRAQTMVVNIAAALSEVDPDNAATYEANAEAYKATLQQTDAEIRALIDGIPPENRKLVTNHDSLGYFADRYGLEIVATVIPNLSTESDPSARQIAELTDLLEELDAPAIFTEQLVDPKIAEQLAHDTGATIVTGLYTDSIGEPGSGADTLHGMLLENARKIAEGLG